MRPYMDDEAVFVMVGLRAKVAIIRGGYMVFVMNLKTTIK